MKAHTNRFKEEIGSFGRQIDSIITYQLNGVTQTITSENLNSVTPTFQGAILKSVMKQLDIDSNVDIPVGTILRYKFGVLVDGEYEYLDYGNYVVYSSKKQEDYNSYKIVCYDKMLYSMKQNEDLGVTYPISVRDYIDALCTKIGLEFKNKTDVFANYDKMITKELYVGQEYTYRDIFDELSQVTASTICLDIDDKVEIRYINKLTDLQIAEGTNITITDSEQDTINSLTLDGRCEQNTTTGKNLFDYVNNLKASSEGLTSVINEDGSITTTGKPSADYRTVVNSIDITNILEDGQTYTISQANVSDKLYMQVYAKKADGTSTYYYLLNKLSQKIKVDKSIYVSYKLTIQTGLSKNWGDTSSTITNKYMLCKGTDTADTSFEPYTGGQPSPNPDYPQEIKTITGNLKLTSCGKNLFDKSLSVANKYINSSDGTLLNSSSSSTSDFINVSENTQYTISGYGTASYYKVVTYYNSSKTFISSIKITNAYDSYSFTTPSNAKYIRFHYTTSNENQVMLNEGTTALPYEPYQGSSLNITIPSNEFVGKIDDTYKDTLNVVYEDDGHYHLILKKMIGKVVLNGSENWRLSSYTNDIIYSVYVAISNYLNGLLISDLFSYQNNANATTTTEYVATGGDSIRIGVLKSRLNASTIDDFKSWLSTHNTEVNYVLKTPYEVDLGIIDMLNTYKGTTHIFNSVDTNMSVTYVNGYETIDEEFLNDVNVNVAKKYGPINSIVLSRSAESDNVYLKDEDSVTKNGLCELKIIDNQIMNWNDRSDYLPDILEKLDGLEYYLNDFVSTGVAYLELCDNYKLKVFDNIYNCILLNDELDVTQGLVENIHTDMPMETETDYTKADKTDRRISNVSLIVDKQQKEINALANKIVDISNNASGIGTLNITNGSKGILHKLDIYGTLELPIVGGQLGTSATKVGYSKVGASLTKTFNKYIKPLIVGQFNVNSFKIIIKQGDNTKEYIIVDMKNLYQVGTTHDTFEYLDGKCSITRRIGLNNDGTKYILDTPYVEQLKDLNIEVPEGDYTISSNYELHLDVEYLTKNEYTDAFAKQVELQSEINVRSDEIDILSKKKVNNDEVIASINLTPEKAQIDANKISLKGKEINLTSDDIEITSNNFKVDKQGNLECKNANVQGKIESKEGNVGGWLISDGSLNNGTNFVRSNGFSNIYTMTDVFILEAYILNESWATQVINNDNDVFNYYDLNHDGTIDVVDLLKMKKLILGVDTQIKEGENNGKN